MEHYLPRLILSFIIAEIIDFDSKDALSNELAY